MFFENFDDIWIRGKSVKAIIAISGTSDAKKDFILPIVDVCISELSSSPIALLCGGNNGTVPESVIDCANKYDLPCIGIMPVRGKKYADKRTDISLFVAPRFGESEWGDESEVFAKLADGMIVIGGKYGTLIEVAHAINISKSRLRHSGSKPIYVAPIVYQDEVSTKICELRFDAFISTILPDTPFTEAIDASAFLKKKLDL